QKGAKRRLLFFPRGAQIKVIKPLLPFVKIFEERVPLPAWQIDRGGNGLVPPLPAKGIERFFKEPNMCFPFDDPAPELFLQKSRLQKRKRLKIGRMQPPFRRKNLPEEIFIFFRQRLPHSPTAFFRSGENTLSGLLF